MQNQFLTEDAAQTSYAPPAIAQAELANVEITTETKDAQTTQAVHQWLAGIQRKTRREKFMFWSAFVFFEALLFLPVHFLRAFPLVEWGHLNLAMMALLFAPTLGILAMALRVIFGKPQWNAAELARIGGAQGAGMLIELVRCGRTYSPSAPV